jgi:autotransporter-associated beta strand protein
VADGTIEFSAPTSTTGNTTTSLIYTGSGETTDRVINLINQLLGGILDQSGSGLLKFTNDLKCGSGDLARDQRKTLTLRGSTDGIGEIAGVIPNSAANNANQRATSIAKSGSGTWILSGANTYTGATTVSDGTLLVNNTTGSGTGSGNVSVTTGTLGGGGAITGAVTIGNSAGSADAILAPGNSIGAIATGNLAFNSDGSFACELSGSSATSDRANVTGTVTINATATLTVSLTGSLAGGQRYFIVVNDGADAVTGTFASLPQDAVVGTFGGTDLKISYTGDSGTSAITGGNDIVLYTEESALTPYESWAATGPFAKPFTSTLPGVDFDGDGLSNLLEFVLGGDPTISQAGIAPTASVSGGNLELTFKRSDASELAPAVTVKVELSADLTFSTPANDITIGAGTDPGPIAPSGASYTVTNSGGFDTITVRIPQVADPKKFARVKAIQTP